MILSSLTEQTRLNLLGLLVAGFVFASSSTIVHAQRGGAQQRDIKAQAEAQGIDLELSREEQLQLKDKGGIREAVNVAEQYSELLARDAIVIEPAERGDPMIVPFIHDKVILEKWREAMENAFSDQDYSLARSYAKQIANKYPDSDEAIVALQIISEIETIIDIGGKDPNPTDDPKIAPWVKSNMSAILYDTEDPVVLIGFDTLRPGDSIPDYPNHVIDEIKPESVVFRVSNEFKTKRLELTVQASDIN